MSENHSYTPDSGLLAEKCFCFINLLVWILAGQGGGNIHISLH